MNLKRVLRRAWKNGCNSFWSASSHAEYIADNERLPFKQTLLSDEELNLWR